jgi:HK97 gp10 family phage protein
MSFEVSGLKESLEALKGLEPKLSKGIVRKGLRAGAKVVSQATKAAAPELTGTLKKGIKVKAGKRKKGFLSYVVGVGKAWFSGPAFYAAFVAFGHKVGSRKLGGSRKQIPANDFMTKGYDQSKNAALTAVISTIESGIDAAVGE